MIHIFLKLFFASFVQVFSTKNRNVFVLAVSTLREKTGADLASSFWPEVAFQFYLVQ
jgi:hypothetical protein